MPSGKGNKKCDELKNYRRKTEQKVFLRNRRIGEIRKQQVNEYGGKVDDNNDEKIVEKQNCTEDKRINQKGKREINSQKPE